MMGSGGFCGNIGCIPHFYRNQTIRKLRIRNLLGLKWDLMCSVFVQCIITKLIS